MLEHFRDFTPSLCRFDNYVRRKTCNNFSARAFPLQVTFSSLDVHLHTEALLNTMNFLDNLLPASPKKGAGQEELPTIPEGDEGDKDVEKKEAVVTKKKSNRPQRFEAVRFKSSVNEPFPSHNLHFTGSKRSKYKDVINLHISADLRSLKVFIRGQKARISEISIEGIKMFWYLKV